MPGRELVLVCRREVDLLRVASKDRDTLQEVMHLLRSTDFGLDLQFINYRSN